jgi:hypothetical protein
LWSFLRRFGKMTKEMRPSHRIDVLSDAILYYGRLCKDKLGKVFIVIVSVLIYIALVLYVHNTIRHNI